MHRVMIVLMLSCCCLFSNCEKEIPYPVAPVHFPGEQEYGWVRATKNGASFEASGIGLRHTEYPDSLIGVEIRTYTDWGADRESIYIGEIEYALGRTMAVEEDDDFENAIPIGFYTTLSDDGDVTEDVYRLDDRQSNWIDIIAIDTIAGEPTISGTFSLHFKMSRENTNPDNPEHVRFTDGTFEVRLPD